MEAADIGSLPATACSWVVASIPDMVARGTLPVRSSKGYISVPWVLGGQGCKATAEVSTKAQQSHPSAIALCSSVTILSLWVCWKIQELVV